MMLKVITLLCLVALCCSQETDAGDQGSLDKLIAEVFGKPVSQPMLDSRNQDSERRNRREVEEKCTTTKGNRGVCIPYYRCAAPLVLDEVGIIDTRVPPETSCSGAIDVCCESKDKDLPLAEPAKREGCGWHNPDGVTFRLNNLKEETQFGEFPWVCAILKDHKIEEANASSADINKDVTKPIYAGSGSLIHPSVVLTAAHVVTNGSALMVRAGEWNTRALNERYPHQERDVFSAEIHEDYNRYFLYYDVALLFLAKPMDLAPNVALACLPPPRETAVSDSCISTGWGKERFGDEKLYAVLLRKIKLPVVDRATCIARLRKTRLGQKFVLHTSFMCAGGEKDHDACMGDGGAPLSCPIENESDRFAQAGIVAWGIGCGGDGTPTIFVDVANLRSWIDGKVAEKGYDPKIYSY